MATKKRNSVEIPKGFKEVDNSLTGFWKPTEMGQTIRGVVGHEIVTKGAEGKPNKFFALRITDPAQCQAVQTGKGEDVEVERGDLVGVGGAILVSFLAAREGQEVFLIFKGLGDKKPGKNPAKLYQTFAREYDAETGEVIPE